MYSDQKRIKHFRLNIPPLENPFSHIATKTEPVLHHPPGFAFFSLVLFSFCFLFPPIVPLLFPITDNEHLQNSSLSDRVSISCWVGLPWFESLAPPPPGT